MTQAPQGPTETAPLLGWLAQLGPFMALAATAGYLGFRWPTLPQRIPTHYGISGRPDAWSAPSPTMVFGPLILGAMIAGLLAFFGWQQRRASRPIHPGALVHYTEARYRHAA